MRVGDYVYWSDPDDNLCDAPGHITEIRGDVYVLQMDAGGTTEALRSELAPVDPSLVRTGTAIELAAAMRSLAADAPEDEDDKDEPEDEGAWDTTLQPGHWAVVLRAHGNDEDSCYIGEHVTELEAVKAAKVWLDAPEGDEVYVNYTLHSTAPIELVTRNV